MTRTFDIVAAAIAEMQDATDDADIIARHVLMRLAESGYMIAYQSLPEFTMMGDTAELAAIAQTLRFVAGWWVGPDTDDDRHERQHRDQATHLLAAAEILDRGEPAELDACCPLCEEVECDESCPIGPHRSTDLA